MSEDAPAATVKSVPNRPPVQAPVGDADQIAINAIRFLAVDMVQQANSGHPGAPMGQASLAHQLWTRHLRFNPKNPDWPNRDRFVLSCGHASALIYTLLHLAGYDLSLEELRNFRQLGSKTPGHPEHGLTPGIETTTGPLGQGFSVASGIAMGKRMRGETGAVYCLTGDGEMQEGLIWETVMSAAHHRLSSLILIISDNDIQIDGRTSRVKKVRPLNRKFEAFDWQVFNVDGHDIAALRDAFERAAEDSERPSCIIAETIMAKGVSFMEGDPKWHGSCPSKQETVNALDELGKVDFLEDF